MTIIAIVPAIVALFSAVAYLLVSKAEAKEIARLAFATSFLAVMLAFAGRTMHIGN
jgi:hypothetical protein